jgi:hypothetical protein
MPRRRTELGAERDNEIKTRTARGESAETVAGPELAKTLIRKFWEALTPIERTALALRMTDEGQQ